MSETLDRSRLHFRKWTAVVLWLIAVLAVFIWAGTWPGSGRFTPWAFTKNGWIVPAQSLTCVWLFAALQFAILCGMTGLLFRPIEGARRLKLWASAGIIVVLAGASRIIVAFTWLPLAAVRPPVAIHLLVIVADLVVIGLLLLALRGSNRSVWWAALYALHPLPLIEVGANGHWIAAAAIPIIFVAAVAHRVAKMMQVAIAGVVALSSVIIVLLATGRPSFNSLLADVADSLNVPGVILPAVAAFVQAAVLLLALRREWALGKTLGHLLVVAIICSPTVAPWMVVPLLALLVLSWRHASWALSMTVLAGLAAAISPRLPMWLLMLEWMPVIVLEAQELLAETLSPAARESSASVAAGAQVR